MGDGYVSLGLNGTSAMVRGGIRTPDPQIHSSCSNCVSPIRPKTFDEPKIQLAKNLTTRTPPERLTRAAKR